MTSVIHEKLSLALDLTGAAPEPPRFKRKKSNSLQYSARDELGIKLNCDLNGYQFQSFSEHYICREELPNGSNTFQQVLDEITEEMDTLPGMVLSKPPPVPPNPRRKSIATSNYTQPFRSSDTRKVRWGNTSVAKIEQNMDSFQRPRVLSDGAIVGKGIRNGLY